MKLLPSPVDLGHPRDFLPSRLLSPETDEYTWEDWETEVKAKHPIKWQLQKFVDWLSRWPRLSNAWYWLRTHTYNRYHLLDLRDSEPENREGYRWGWVDRCSAITLANFLILRQFVEQEKPWSCADRIKKLEAEGDPSGELTLLRAQQADYDECMTLYRWWIKDRFAEYEAFDRDEERARERYKADSSEDNRKAWFCAAEARSAREQEMLHRLISIRQYLWT